MVDVAGLELTPEDREVLRHPLVGSVILFTRNYADSAQLARLVADIHAVRQPALIVAVDQEGGRVQRFRPGFAALPAPRRMGHEFDVEPKAGIAFARSMGWLMAAELRATVSISRSRPVSISTTASAKSSAIARFIPGPRSWRNSRSPTWAA
jgi:beta-N-acetylhexosaminidase